MISFSNIKTIFFDYDGTIHNSIKIYGPAFRKAYSYLVEQRLVHQRDWSDEEISYWLGFNPQEMWKKFMPDLEENIRSKCSEIIGEEMDSLIDKGKPELYEGALDTLKYLKSKGYRLVFISNCKLSYKDSHSRLFGLGDYFEELACSEEYNFIPKYEILRDIKGKYCEEMAIIGDRFQDIEAGKKNGICTIGCSYGFSLKGELDEADLIIKSISELKIYL
ncbi:HAD family hydrolase [Tissierella creatinini]|nr:HAD family hydrolase [Tissierella creatinini]TJX63822.1 HAD family hydrolase [Soehngenia saccharolytica]